MHKKIAKAITSSLMAATMIASSAVALVPMSASAGNCLGQNDFDDGVGLPWHICVTNPAEQKFTISGGTYNCTIVNPGGKTRGGDSRWDCQFRHRGLHIESGHSYKIHWEVDASNAGELHTHIGPLSGEGGVWQNNSEQWSQGWNNVKISKGKNEFDSSFTASETLEVAEWAFHYGGSGPFQDSDCFPEGTTLKFDNMTLECTTCGSSYKNEKSTPCLWDPTNELGVITPRSDVRINQVGYYPKSEKKATYATSSEKSAVSFTVKDSSGKSVFTGKGKVVGYDKDAGDYCQILDFSSVQTPGTYTIEVDDKSNTFKNKKTGETYDMWKSHEFVIGDDVYDGVLKNAMNYYYQNRSGMDIEEAYITSYNPKDPGGKKKLAHKGGHAPSDNAYVQSEWVKSYGQEFDGDKGTTVDCVGGWYDAGDHGKYVVNGGISVWTLQNMFERSKVMKQDSKWADGKAMTIPQSYSVGNIKFNGTGSPDVLDEARVELEWMFNMIVTSKDNEWGSSCKGLVYHKMHDHKWTGLATKPFDYQEEWGTTRIVKPPTYAATFNMIACAARSLLSIRLSAAADTVTLTLKTTLTGQLVSSSLQQATASTMTSSASIRIRTTATATIRHSISQQALAAVRTTAHSAHSTGAVQLVSVQFLSTSATRHLLLIRRQFLLISRLLLISMLNLRMVLLTVWVSHMLVLHLLMISTAQARQSRVMSGVQTHS